jgi:glycosyltransferase involved in cell wall biosynthesis
VDTFKTIYSNKTFDYMSCKKATLLAIDGVSRELINEANCGVYVEPENPSAIAAGIRSVLNDPNKLIEMGENGYNHALQNFDRKVLASRYLDHMKTVIK